MASTRQQWTAGDRLVVRATRCTVTAVERLRECDALRLAPHVVPDVPFGTLLVPFDRPRAIRTSAGLRATRPRRWLHTVRRAAAQHHRFGSLRTAATANIQILPYQLEPALAMLRHAWLRVLVADAVGLGKTIQAGLTLAEVLDGNDSRRALAIVPAGLRDQWASELATHFGIDAEVCDAVWLRRRVRDLPADANPWALPGTYVVSLDFIKQPEVLRPMEDLLWDFVVVDEAHLVTSGTDRRVAVNAIAGRARRVMLLTATPHSGDEAQFEALCRLGEGVPSTPIVLFRRTRSDVAHQVPRRSTLLRVRLSEPERRMHALLDRYTVRVWRESHARSDRVARLVPIVLRKRALSSPTSLAASLARRIDLLAGMDRDGARQRALPMYGHEDEIGDAVRDEVLAAPGLANATLERRWLGTLLELSRRAAAQERKVVRLRRYLSRINEPAIVFTEYRDTLTRLLRVVQPHSLPVYSLHGGMSDEERRAVQRAFNEHDSVLLATDAAAEGLNLQRRCRIVIHFELPWNPLRLEQRTGRVDRIGQTRRVHEVALVADDTAERVVLGPLARRARTAANAAPGGSAMLERLSEMAVAEAVITGRTDRLGDVPRAQRVFAETNLATEAIAEGARIDAQRLLLSSRQIPGEEPEQRPTVTVWRPRRGAGIHRFTLVYTLSLETYDGRRVHAEPFVLSFARLVHPTAVCSAADAIREAQRALLDADAAVGQRIERRLTAIQDDVMPLHRALILALSAREAAIAQLQASAARELVQAGLFDRRALRRADARYAAERSRREDAEQQHAVLQSAGSLTPRVTLVGALLHTGELA